MPRHPDVVESLLYARNGENACPIRAGIQCSMRTLNPEPSVSLQILLWKNIMPPPRIVRASEPISPIIAAFAELRLPRCRFEIACIRLETEIAPANRNGETVLRVLYRPAA